MNAANKAWYWLAAGVLALGLNGYYQDGGLQGLHPLAESSASVMAESRAQFNQAATLAEVALAEKARCQRQAPSEVVAAPQARARLAQLQERLGEMQAARVQAQLSRLQQVMAQRELQRAQVELQNRRISVVNDEGQIQVALPRLPRVEVDAPEGPVVDVSQPN